MRRALASALLAAAVASLAHATPARRLALTFDDLPAQRAHALPEARIERLTAGILAALAARQAPAVGFVNEDKLEVDGAVRPSRVALLERWLDAGHELGNHAYSHPDLHRTDLAGFQADVARGERVTRALAAERGLPYRWFRHPYLHTGTDLAVRDALAAFLAARGLRVAPVTIDNSEWIFARAYDEALDRNDPALAGRLGAAYADYMAAMTAYYETQSVALFGREIPQVLLLHANALNGDHLAALLGRLAARGYRFVTLGEALADPAYASPDRYHGRGGITWLHRWAITRGADRAMFAGEPRTPAWVQEIAGIEE